MDERRLEVWEWLPKRLRSAWHDYQARHKEITQKQIAQMLTARLGEPFTDKAVSNWFSEREDRFREPSFVVGCALAEILDADPARIAAVPVPIPSVADEGEDGLLKGRRGSTLADKRSLRRRRTGD